MTYSLIEQEEILFENKLNELLTETEPENPAAQHKAHLSRKKPNLGVIGQHYQDRKVDRYDVYKDPEKIPPKVDLHWMDQYADDKSIEYDADRHVLRVNGDPESDEPSDEPSDDPTPTPVGSSGPPAPVVVLPKQKPIVAKPKPRIPQTNVPPVSTPKPSLEVQAQTAQAAQQRIAAANLKIEQERLEKERVAAEQKTAKDRVTPEKLTKILADAERLRKELLKKIRKTDAAVTKANAAFKQGVANNLSKEDLKKLKQTLIKQQAARQLAGSEFAKVNSASTGINKYLTQTNKQSTYQAKTTAALTAHARQVAAAYALNRPDVTNDMRTEFKREQTAIEDEIKRANKATTAIRNAAQKGAKTITYTVVSGEVLGKIALRYGVSLAELVTLNKIQEAGKITVGQSIKIPVKGNISSSLISSVDSAKSPPKRTKIVFGSSVSKPTLELIRGTNGEYYLQDPKTKETTSLSKSQAQLELSKMGAASQAKKNTLAKQISRRARARSLGATIRGGAGLIGFHMVLSALGKFAWTRFEDNFLKERDKLPKDSPLRKLSPNQFFQGKQFYGGHSPFSSKGPVAEGVYNNFGEYIVGGTGFGHNMSPGQINSRRKTFREKFSKMTERDLNTNLFLPLSQRGKEFEIVVQKPDGTFINLTAREKRARAQGKDLDPNTFINDGDVVIYTKTITVNEARDEWNRRANTSPRTTNGAAPQDIQFNVRALNMKVFHMTRSNTDHLPNRYKLGGTHETSLNPNWDPDDFVGKRAKALGNNELLGVGLWDKTEFQGNPSMAKTWRNHQALMKEFRAAELEAIRKGEIFDPSSDPKFIKFTMTDTELEELRPKEGAITDEPPEKDLISTGEKMLSDFGSWSGLYDYPTNTEEKIARAVGEPGEKNQPSALDGADGTPQPASAGWPTTAQKFETIITDLSTKYDIDPNLLKALSEKESGSSTKNKWKQGKFKGDTDLGVEGAWGLFHVRKGDDTGDEWNPAGVDDYNVRNSTTYQWDQVASDPYLAANIGAALFSVYYKENTDKGLSPEKAAWEAYAEYNGGAGWRTKSSKVQDGIKKKATAFVAIFKELNLWQTESKITTKKSAILDGIAIAA
tara:strand:+ start:3408 stop:6698 length:3291 start_codon:yes stop_codon:yes gene_type:complete